MVITIIFFVLLIGILVLIHEFGHFFAAKKFGVRVDEFAFGFPPRILSVVRNGTRYALNLLPIGGYVKIFGESGEGEGLPESFISRPVWQRFLIIVAGVAMNLVLAWFFFSIGSGIGLPSVVTSENKDKIQNVSVGIVGVAKNSPSESADLRFGDLIASAKVDGEAATILEPEDFQNFIFSRLGREVTLTIKRGSATLEKNVTPRLTSPEGEGPLGVVLSQIGVIKTPWYSAWWEGLKMLFNSLAAIVVGIFFVLRDLIFAGRVSADISGPVGIFVFARQFGDLGISYLLQLAAILSVNLAILNALPFPALDGGRILFLVIEKIKGSRVDQRVERAIHTAGFVILILLMLAVTYRDIARIL
ncbi:MAG: site-2 protease family protein [Candidatus Sungbacteria bacterium]|nr:site-2 protease family protein [Candidatus Sungbacteria bacterium]